jgi:hypothetical protein
MAGAYSVKQVIPESEAERGLESHFDLLLQ